ncbi:MAG TPA: RraA family protein, partial [Solirubrobacteraceae bacterium]|nr:RraA family protein [Solirubrobacteraceae bacterium]
RFLPSAAAPRKPMSDGHLAALAEFSTSAVSDALDALGISGQVAGIYPLARQVHLVGRAFTVAYQPVDVQGGTVGDCIDDVPPGAVVVLDNSGRLDATVWGDILTLAAHGRGLAGTVIDGVCRDSPRSLQLGYPLFTRGHWMRSGKDRVQLSAINEPVTLSDVRVRADDVLLGDADGVVVIPAGHEDDVIEKVTQIEAAEQLIREKVISGSRLDEARANVDYFSLQRRPGS